MVRPQRKAHHVSVARFPGGKRRVAAAASTALIASSAALLATAPAAHAATVEVQILGTNDFHGRLLRNVSPPANEAGAAQFGGAVEQLRADFAGDTIFTAAGDLIGASTFESFIQKDKPTIDAFNAMRLDVSAAGNHEFDGGYADLNDRVMAPGHAEGGAKWVYLASNVRKKSDNSYALRSVTPDAANNHNGANASDGGTWMAETPGGAKVGFVGAVTEELPSLVSPGGIVDVKVTKIVDEVNAGAASLRAAGADMVVMLVHEGYGTSDCNPTSPGNPVFQAIVDGVKTNVSAVISGHTHLSYTCTASNGIPVVSAGQYGTNLDVLKFTVDTTANTATLNSSVTTAANSVTLSDPAAIALRDNIRDNIVNPAVAQADVLGARVLGQLGGPFYRAKMANGTSENRGGESTLGNLVAEVQRWSTESDTFGGAQIAFMNPGGLRQDMLGIAAGTGAYPSDLTYKQAAVVQPFANTLVNMRLTGDQIKKVLEQQWQPAGSSRPFLRLGTSAGFTSTYDASRPEGDRITGMWLNGTPISPSTSYSVTVNSFLSTGGDNFFELANGTSKRDTGKVDLASMVDYMAAKSPASPSFAQQQVGVVWPSGASNSVLRGAHAKFDLTSLAMSVPADKTDTSVKGRLGGTDLGSFPVDNTLGTVVADESGKASVDVVIPANAAAGATELVVTGNNTGTVVRVPIKVVVHASTVKATVDPGTVKFRQDKTGVTVAVTSAGKTPTGAVEVWDGAEKVGSGSLHADGQAYLSVGPFDKVGIHTLTVKYLGDTVTAAGEAKVEVDVVRAKVKLRLLDRKLKFGDAVLPIAVRGFKYPRGKVVVKVIKPKGAKHKVKARLGKRGKVKIDLKDAKFKRPGKYIVVVKYRGNSTTLPTKKKRAIWLKR